MASNRVCPDTSSAVVVAHYEIPRETYSRLQDLVLVMDGSEATKPYAAALRSLCGEVVCVLEVESCERNQRNDERFAERRELRDSSDCAD